MAVNEFTTIEDIQAHPKELSDYSKAEKEVINTSWDKLNEEEQLAFQTFRPEQAPIVEDVPAAPEPVITPETPVAVPTTQPTAPTMFQTPEQVEAFVKGIVEGTKPKEEPKAPTSNEPPKLFEDDYVPQNANEYALMLANNPVFAEELRKALAPKIKEDIKSEQELTRKQQDDRQAEFVKQYQALIEAKKVPSLLNEDGTPNEDGVKVNDAIAKVGNQYGLGTYEKSYELWSKLPKEVGGGYDLKGQIIETQKAKITEQKKAASMVGKGVGAEAAKGEKPDEWKQRHNMTMDQLLAARTSK